MIDPKKATFTLRLITAAFLVSILVYGLVVVLAARQLPAAPLDRQDRTFIALLGVMSLVGLVAGFAVKRLAFAALPPEKARALRQLVSLAFFESITIYGLVVFFQYHHATAFIPFAAVSFVAIALSWPRAETSDVRSLSE